MVDHGTGTILDVDGIRPEPWVPGGEPPWQYEGFFLSPLPEEVLTVRYGSARPAPGTVGDGDLPEVATDDGRYIITYTGDEPATVVFCGLSSW